MADRDLDFDADRPASRRSSAAPGADIPVNAENRDPAPGSDQEAVGAPGPPDVTGTTGAGFGFPEDAGRSGITAWMSVCEKCSFL